MRGEEVGGVVVVKSGSGSRCGVTPPRPVAGALVIPWQYSPLGSGDGAWGVKVCVAGGWRGNGSEMKSGIGFAVNMHSESNSKI